MTSQSPDILIVRGQRLDLLARPLEDSRKWKRRAAKLPIPFVSSANWRGYTCIWEIRDSQLWLTGLEGIVEEDGRHLPLTLDHMVPPAKQPLLADWVTDVLYAEEGAEMAATHAGFMRKSERDHIFTIESGKVVSEVLRINPPPPIAYSVEPDGKRTLLDRDPHLYDGFGVMKFAAYRYLMESNTPWEEGTHFRERVADLFAPDETPTGGPYWAMLADFYARRACQSRDKDRERERFRRETLST